VERWWWSLTDCLSPVSGGWRSITRCAAAGASLRCGSKEGSSSTSEIRSAHGGPPIPEVDEDRIWAVESAGGLGYSTDLAVNSAVRDRIRAAAPRSRIPSVSARRRRRRSSGTPLTSPGSDRRSALRHKPPRTRRRPYAPTAHRRRPHPPRPSTLPALTNKEGSLGRPHTDQCLLMGLVSVSRRRRAARYLRIRSAFPGAAGSRWLLARFSARSAHLTRLAIWSRATRSI
jgi:hypothetical protein